MLGESQCFDPRCLLYLLDTSLAKENHITSGISARLWELDRYSVARCRGLLFRQLNEALIMCSLPDGWLITS